MADFKHVLEIASDMGVGSVDILGGEPTLHLGFLSMLEAIELAGLKTRFSSNGTNVDVLRRASARFSTDAVVPGISVNSEPVGEGLHDYIMTMKPVVKSVCTRKRAVPPGARPYVDVPGIEYSFLFMDVVDARYLPEALTFPAYLEILASLSAVHPNVKGVHCGFLGEGPRCPGGTTKLTVLPDGSVFPCYLLARHPEFRLGNICEDPFSGIWGNPILDLFRSSSENPCRKTHCRVHGTCKGGCPAMSLLLSGSLHAPDPRCSL